MCDKISKRRNNNFAFQAGLHGIKMDLIGDAPDKMESVEISEAQAEQMDRALKESQARLQNRKKRI